MKTELKQRTKLFAIEIIKLVNKLPRTRTGSVISNQILRSSTSVAANYRAACRARSTADFISKITIVEEESDETHFWLELIRDIKLSDSKELHSLLNEADELTAIFTASGRTAKINKGK